MIDFWMLAQATDPISGGAGWVGAGLLGAILFWLLFKHLPAKDAQLENLMGKHALHVDRLYESINTMQQVHAKERSDQSVKHAEERTQQFARFETIVDKVMTQQDRMIRELIEEMKLEFKEVAEKIDGIHR